MSKHIWYGGGEVAAHRRELARHGVRKLAFNVHPIITSRSGNAGAPGELEPYATVFYTSQHVEDEAMATIVEGYADDMSVIVGMQFAGISEGTCIPRWNGVDIDEFHDLVAKHGSVFMDEADAAVERNARSLTGVYHRNPSMRVFTPTSKAAVVGLPFVTDPLVTGWIAATKHRELQVWDGSKVRRSPRASRAKSVEKFYGQIEALECVPELLVEEEPAESVKLAIRSWSMYEKVVTNDDDDRMSDDVQESSKRPTNKALARVQERKLIPIMEVRTINPGDESERSVVALANSTFQSCNNCAVSSACPSYERDHECAWEFPVQLRSTAQAIDWASTLIELKIKRILRAAAEEELIGEGLNSDLSRELESAMRMMKLAKELHETHETITISTKSNGGGGGGGLISQFFGSAVGQATNRELSPVIEDIDSAEILEAEVVSR